MFNNNSNPYYFHFVSDLRRVVFCIQNNSLDGARTFLDHANDIYEKKLKTDSVFTIVAQNFDTVWETLYHTAISSDEKERQEYAEQILTLSSIVMMRATHVYETPKNKVQISSVHKHN